MSFDGNDDQYSGINLEELREKSIKLYAKLHGAHKKMKASVMAIPISDDRKAGIRETLNSFAESAHRMGLNKPAEDDKVRTNYGVLKGFKKKMDAWAKLPKPIQATDVPSPRSKPSPETSASPSQSGISQGIRVGEMPSEGQQQEMVKGVQGIMVRASMALGKFMEPYIDRPFTPSQAHDYEGPLEEDTAALEAAVEGELDDLLAEGKEAARDPLDFQQDTFSELEMMLNDSTGPVSEQNEALRLHGFDSLEALQGFNETMNSDLPDGVKNDMLNDQIALLSANIGAAIPEASQSTSHEQGATRPLSRSTSFSSSSSTASASTTSSVSTDWSAFTRSTASSSSASLGVGKAVKGLAKEFVMEQVQNGNAKKAAKATAQAVGGFLMKKSR